MPITDPYATPTQYRSIAGKSDTGSDVQIASDILSVSRWLDQKLGRFFSCDAAPVARVFTPPGSLRLRGQFPLGWAESENPWIGMGWSRNLTVDDMAFPPTSVIIDTNYSGTFVGDLSLNLTPLAPPSILQDCELWPMNAPLGPEPAPYSSIVLRVGSSNLWGWIPSQRVQVTAQWGWPAIPPAIMTATCHLTAILRLESPRATTRVNELMQTVGVSPQAQGIVYELEQRYRRKESIL